MYPSLSAQLELHAEQLMKQAGIDPIASSIGKAWLYLGRLSEQGDIRIRPDVLAGLREPETYALLEGALESGFLWRDQGWVWERWYRGYKPVEVVRGTLAEIAALAGASTALVTGSFADPPAGGPGSGLLHP